MEKQQLPPSYNDVIASQSPSAPMMEGYSPPNNAQTMNQGWNPHMNQYHQHAVTAQPMIQPQVFQPNRNQGGMHQQMLPQQMAPQQTIVIINQHIPLGEDPVNMICPSCRQQTVTRVQYESSVMTHILAGALCLLGWCPCACLVYCTNCTKNVSHSCSKCNSHVGFYRRNFRSR